MKRHRTIFVTVREMERLRHIIQSAETASPKHLAHVKALEQELNRAEIVPTEIVPNDVVTMNSRVRLRDLDSGSDATYILVFPREANVAQAKISVLAPLGAALLGSRSGDVIALRTPIGERRFKVQTQKAAEQAA